MASFASPASTKPREQELAEAPKSAAGLPVIGWLVGNPPTRSAKPVGKGGVCYDQLWQELTDVSQRARQQGGLYTDTNCNTDPFAGAPVQHAATGNSDVVQGVQVLPNWRGRGVPLVKMRARVTIEGGDPRKLLLLLTEFDLRKVWDKSIGSIDHMG